MTFDVVGFGALNVDRLYKVNLIAREEEESFVTDYKESPGGSAANAIVGLARLKLTTSFIGKVAEDREGELLLKSFKEENVNTDGIAVSREGRSGVVTGYVDDKGARALYVDPGVNDWLEFQEINLDCITDAEFLHLTSFVGEKPFEAQERLISQLSDVKISFDPGILYVTKGLVSLKPIIKRSFVMLPNAKEVRLLTGRDFEEGARVLTRAGASIVAVKLGNRGCYVTNGAEDHFVEAYEVKAVDTTGAGDAFCAGFIFGLITEQDLYTCGKLGNFVASQCIAEMGARTGLPRLPDLKRAGFLRAS